MADGDLKQGSASTVGPEPALVTLEELHKARKVLMNSEHCVRTPLLKHVQSMFGINGVDLYLKLENMQVTGSFKIRGVIYQLSELPAGTGTDARKIVTASAGNYGKAFGYIASKMGLKGLVLLPESAPKNRTEIIEAFGVETERVPGSHLLWPTIRRYERERNMVEVHSFDDPRLIQGYASAGFEILEDMSEGGYPDVVLVCCGGGGLVSGIASAIKLSKLNPACKIYGVEPHGSRTMYESFKADHAVEMDVKSVASGLSPPSAGKTTYKHCKAFVEDIILVSDEEIVSAMFALYNRGLVVEPSGAAAFAAMYHGKVAVATGSKVVVVITGGNVTPEELAGLQNFSAK